MPDLHPPDSSPTTGVTPPPLPHKVRLFKIACWLGVGFGVTQFVCMLLLSLLPGEILPLAYFIAMAAASLEVFSALFVLRHQKGGRGIFTGASIAVSFCYVTMGGFIVAILNLIPLLLLVASSSPDAASKTQESDPFEADGSPSSTETSPPKEDLY